MNSYKINIIVEDAAEGAVNIEISATPAIGPDTDSPAVRLAMAIIKCCAGGGQ